jgi:hypothetical protein
VKHEWRKGNNEEGKSATLQQREKRKKKNMKNEKREMTTEGLIFCLIN